MKQALQPNNSQNHISSKEKDSLLSILRNNETNNLLQTHLYQRGDQSTVENGWAKYIKVTEDWLYEKYIESPEETIRDSLNIKKELEEYDTVFDLWPWWWRTTKYINNKQLYRPIDISAYVIDYIKRTTNIHIEWTIGDWFTTKVFNESQGEKAYIIGKTIPNLSDEEVIQLAKSLQPTKNGKSKLIVSYFPDFEETDDNINKLLAIYGDPNKNNPYYNEQSHKNISNFISGLFISLWFWIQDIEQDVIYDKNTHTVIIGIRIKKDITIQTDRRTFTWKKDEFIPAIQSRRRSNQDVQNLLAKSGRKRTQHKRDQRIAVDIFEKVDPNQINNIMKKIWNALIFLSLLWWTAVGLQNGFEKHEKTYFLEQKQQKIQKELSQIYTPEQIAYFNDHIEETKKILKTFYGIQDDGYLDWLIRPYMKDNPKLVEYIMGQKGSYGDISPISTPMSEYIAMVIMKDQEKHNFLEYFGDDNGGYKNFDSHISHMLHTLQYYDSLQTINWSHEIKPEQKLTIQKESTSSTWISPIKPSSQLIGKGILYPGTQTDIYTINNPILGNKSGGNILLVTNDNINLDDQYKIEMFIKNYLSYRHQTKYLAWQTSEYINQELQKRWFDNDPYWALDRIRKIEHIIQEYVLHGWDTKTYLTSENIGQKVFEDLICINPKCTKFFKEQMLIDIETMTKLPWYEQRRGKHAMARWESSAYRNNPDYQEASKIFWKRD